MSTYSLLTFPLVSMWPPLVLGAHQVATTETAYDVKKRKESEACETPRGRGTRTVKRLKSRRGV